MDVTTLSPVKQARREKILDAAEDLFLYQGLRATTIEGVAAGVGMSKVTVYSYFTDKDALFTAVAARFAEQMEEEVRTALATHSPAAERVEAALLAKHKLVHDRIRLAPFAVDIFLTKTRLSRARFQALDSWIIAKLTEVLRDERLARLLFHASQGIANGVSPWGEAEADITQMVRRVLAAAPV